MSQLKNEFDRLSSEDSARLNKDKAEMNPEQWALATNNVFQSIENDMKDHNKHKTRHHKHVRTQLHDLAKVVKHVSTHQRRMESEVKLLRHNFTNLDLLIDHMWLKMSHFNNLTKEHEETKSFVKKSVRSLSDKIEAIPKFGLGNKQQEDYSLVKLHASTVKLFETLETLQEDYGRTIGDLQKEASKLEFNMAQSSSSLSILKEDQTAYYESLKTVRRDVTLLRSRADSTRVKLLNVQSALLNCSLSSALQNARIGHLESQLNINPEQDKSVDVKDNLRRLQERLRQLEDKRSTNRVPTDCDEVNSQTSGEYSIQPQGLDRPIKIWCQFEDDGAWNVIQRRSESSPEEFQRSWDEYKNGFGSAKGSYWIGNEVLNRLTSQGNYSLDLSMWDSIGRLHKALYSRFNVENEDALYRLQVSGYHGNSTDALRHHDGRHFSTWDSDNDESSSHCAEHYEGGWWYDNCQFANLNAKRATWQEATTNEWLQLKNVQMAIRRNVPIRFSTLT